MIAGLSRLSPLLVYWNIAVVPEAPTSGRGGSWRIASPSDLFPAIADEVS
jgi:hypothetical protein